MKELSYPYEFRARTCGVVDWLCGYCGHLNRTRVTRTTWRVQCAGKDCRRWFAVGVIFHTLPRAGRQPIPPPDITFPAAEVGRWESGQPVNCLVTGDVTPPDNGDANDAEMRR